jgi:hypothetical protein
VASFGGRISSRKLRLTAPALVALSVPAAFVACGPSVQSIHEGSVRFEHCYRLDLDLEIAPGHREACWKEWLSSYTYGQSADRIDYARRRVRAISSGDTSRPELDIAGERRPEERQFYLVVPGPTSMHAPPAPIATRVIGLDGGVPPMSPTAAPPASLEPVPPAPPAPEDDCAKACRTAHQSCSAACGADAGSAAACKSCEPDYKSCMRRCFR